MYCYRAVARISVVSNNLEQKGAIAPFLYIIQSDSSFLLQEITDVLQDLSCSLLAILIDKTCLCI